jgi:hypothetical protein
MKRVAAPFACLLVLSLMSGASQAAPAPSAVPAIVEHAMAAYAAEMRGAIGMMRHFSTSIQAGPIRHGETSESGVLLEDGAFSKIKYYQVTQDGKAFDATKLAQRDSQTNTDWAAGKIFFKEPYDPRFIGDYTFALSTGCVDCPAGTVAVAFTSAVRDAQHGSGTMLIDSANARVETLTYSPNAFPPHATSGKVTETSSESSGIWYVTHIDESYRGHSFILTGTGTFTGTFDHFRRFPSVGEGDGALGNGTI